MEVKKRKLLTLCFIHEHPRVLLGMKKKGFGAGLWNGFGGKVEPGESVEDAARREVREEAGVEIEYMAKHGIIEFEFQSDPVILEVHVFKAEGLVGEPAESDEMKPQWFFVEDIPFRQMWSDDLYWLPLLLKGKTFRARFLFDKPSTAESAGRIVEKHIEETDGI